MRVVLKKPNENPDILDVEDNLKSYQNLVGGLIDIVRLPTNMNVALIVDDEGKLKGYEANVKWYDDTLNGNVVAVGINKSDGEFRNLKDSEIRDVFNYMKENEIEPKKLIEIIFVR